MSSLPTVVPIPCLRDNYAYLVLGGDGGCVVVDASETEPVQAEIRKRGLELRAILTTHHHWDHVGGNLELASEWSCPVVGHTSEQARIPGFTRGVEHEEVFEEGGLSWRALHVPGHTTGALTYVLGEAAFTGDTLFCGGCGRLFEGSAAEMYASLTGVLGALPEETLIYCGHEYTEGNLAFARTVLDGPELEARWRDVSAKREVGKFTASATLAVERQTNPFLRCDLPEMQKALGKEGSPVEAFAELRSRKDRA